MYRDILTERVFLLIKTKWPEEKDKSSFVQQDNTTLRISENTSSLISDGTAKWWQARMRIQPVNSPDVNILGLSFFESVQFVQKNR